jgi:hypothetical protein
MYARGCMKLSGGARNESESSVEKVESKSRKLGSSDVPPLPPSRGNRRSKSQISTPPTPPIFSSVNKVENSIEFYTPRLSTLDFLD